MSDMDRTAIAIFMCCTIVCVVSIASLLVRLSNRLDKVENKERP